MHQAIFSGLCLLALGLPVAQASPRPQFICTSGNTYTIDSQHEIPGDSQVGTYSVSGASGTSTLSRSTSYSVGVTITVGADIGLSLEGIVSAGISGSVSTTTTKGTTDGAGDVCPKGAWSCSLDVTPTLIEVSGKQTPYNSCIEGPAGPVKPYTVRFPKIGSDGNPFINVRMCTCKNLDNWADPGHPGLICPADCALP